MDTIKFNYKGREREALVGLIDDVDEIIYRVTLDDGYENNQTRPSRVGITAKRINDAALIFAHDPDGCRQKKTEWE